MVKFALTSAATLATLAVTAAAPAADKVKQVPGFNTTSFDVYSGYLTVPGPFEQTPYSKLKIHYQFQTSQGDPAKDPVATWHQGGPGGSSIDVGLYTEMGYFQIDDHGPYVNPYSWNQVASMLYLESPAGSGSDHGFSECYMSEGSKPVACHWNDTSQAEAYAHTLMAFYTAFPEFANNDLYLTGESYAGQYLPNIAHYIINNAPFKTKLPLKGLALGNACWGGNATNVNCNGIHAQKNMADIYHGKGLSSEDNYADIYKKCDWDTMELSAACYMALDTQRKQVGPHNVYNIYDNCEEMANFLSATGLTTMQVQEAMWAEMDTGVPATETLSKLVKHDVGDLLSVPKSGGYPWSCGGMDTVETWIQKPDVMEALHISNPGRSDFNYHSSGPASITLHPELSKNLRMLIYNGDADACVPYKGNEEWIQTLVTAGDLSVGEDWRPWYNDEWPNMPAGYVTTYNVTGVPSKDFHFLTIRLAGHMVPTFQPASSLSFIKRFLAGENF